MRTRFTDFVIALIGAIVLTAFLLYESHPARFTDGFPSGATVLHLSATAEVPVTPDLLVADLVAQNTSPAPADAQRQVNALVAEAVKEAHGVAGVDARATGYAVDPTDEKHTAWSAQQTVELRGANGPTLLDLAGRLQAHGLIMASLDWQLSDKASREAHDTATIAALAELRNRARDAATALHLQVDRFSDVRLDAPTYAPRPFPMRAMIAGPMAAPQATQAGQNVSADVSADVALIHKDGP